MPTTDCYSCAQERLGGAAPRRERIVVTAHWRVAHCIETALEGWLVVLPRRHVLSLHQLTGEESAELGPLLREVATALHAELGERCAKTYVMQFSEAEGFEHLHFHVVPRSPTLPAEHRGPRVVHFLGPPAEEWVSDERREELAGRLAARLEGEDPDPPTTS